MVTFGRWFSVEDAAATAPDVPGVFQVRGEALRDYPLGRTAMLLYGHSRADETLRAHLAQAGAPALLRAAALGARFIRYAPSATPDAACARLLRRFIDRFGAAPSAHAAPPDR